MIRNYLGRAGIKCSAPQLHRRALRAHINFLQFACNVPIETEPYVPVAPQCLQSLSFEPLPRLRHCPRQGMPGADQVRGSMGNHVLSRGRLASHLHCWVGQHSFGVVLVKRDTSDRISTLQRIFVACLPGPPGLLVREPAVCSSDSFCLRRRLPLRLLDLWPESEVDACESQSMCPD